MKNLIAFMISSALAFSVHGEEKPINDSPIDKYEKEQQVMRSCVKAGGTPSRLLKYPAAKSTPQWRDALSA